MNLETVTGMVLSAMPIGEYDKRLVILTRERGKISAFAKGARRTNNGFMACSQPFAFGRFTLYQGRNSYTLNGADIQNYFEELRDDIEKITYASYFCEVAAYLSYENVEAVGLLKLLYQSMKALNHPKIPKKLIQDIFEIKALTFNGEMPQVFSCIKCKREQQDLHDVFYGGFSSRLGGMVCKECRQHANDLCEVSSGSLYALQHIVTSKVEKLYTFLLEERALEQLNRIAEQYMKCYANGQFHSLEMLEMLALTKTEKATMDS